MDIKTSGERLRDERRRLNLTQQEFSDLVAVSKSSQVGYEAGARPPDARYLAAAASAGVDIMYVITGQGISEITANQFEWGKLSSILQTIDSWLSERDLVLPHEKKMGLAELFYSHFKNTDDTDENYIEQKLSQVA